MRQASAPPAMEVLLRGAVEDARGLATSVAEFSKRSLTGGSAEALAALREQLTSVDKVRTALGTAVAQLSLKARVEEDQRASSAEAFPQRLADLHDSWRGDEASAPRRWLVSWTQALLAGRFSEAERLATSEITSSVIPPWLPVRAAQAADAVEQRSAIRFAGMATFLLRADDNHCSDVELPAGTRARIAALHARLLVLAEDWDEADSVLELARPLATGDPAVEAAVWASASVLRRSRPARPAQMEDIDQEWSSRLSDRGSYLAIAVELAQGSIRGAVDDHEAALRRATRAMAEVADPVGLPRRLGALIDHLPGEIWAGAAARAVTAGLLDDAELLLEHATGSEIVVAAAAAMRTEVARARGASGAELAALHVDAGLAAHIAQRLPEAVAHYDRALEANRNSASATRRLAEALAATAYGQAPGLADATLEKALALCAWARELEPLTEQNAWVFIVESDVHWQFVRAATPARPVHLWKALWTTARGVAMLRNEAQRWTALAWQLLEPGLPYAAHVAALQACFLAPDDVDAAMAKVATLIHVGRQAEALDLLQSINPPPPESLTAAVRAVIHHRNGETEAMRTSINTAVASTDKTAVASTDLSDLWFEEVRLTAAILNGARTDALDRAQELWRRVTEETYAGACLLAWAALVQGLTGPVASLAERLRPTEYGVPGDWTGMVVRGLAQLMDGDSAGWHPIRAALRGQTSVADIEQLRQLVHATLHLRGGPGVDLGPLQRLAEEASEVLTARDRHTDDKRQASDEVRLASEWLADLPGESGTMPREEVVGVGQGALALVSVLLGSLGNHADVQAALDALSGSEDEAVIASLRRWNGPVAQSQADEPDEPSGGEVGVADEEVVRLGVPPSWFADLEGPEEDHDLFTRHLPDLRAAQRLAGVPQLPPTRVHVDPRLEPSYYRVEAAGHVLAGDVPEPWYCPRNWWYSLTAASRDSDAEPIAVRSHDSPPYGPHDLLVAPPPTEALSALVIWPALEVVLHEVAAFYEHTEPSQPT